MRTLFSRILLAQVVAVVVSLLVVTVITRVSLNRGFKDFLGRQETAVLQTLAPALGEIHERQSGWDMLRDRQHNWRRIWQLTQPQPGRPGRGGPPGRGDAPPGDGVDPRLLRWLMAPERGMLRERLFLLDENRSRIAGADPATLDGISLEAIESGGGVVGWIGFAPMGNQLPPDARQFMTRQIRLSFVSLAAALLVAAILAFFLARNVSRPVRQLGATVGRLSRGDYRARAARDSRDEIGKLAKHVNQLAESLEKNRTARQRWMADIAHELRTPVAILRGEIESLVDGVRPADKRMTASLREEVEHLTALVDDLQTLALSDAGALNLRREPLNPAALVEQCVETFRDRLHERGIQVEGDMEEHLNIEADPQRLRQLLHNMLENASRYVVPNGTLQVTLKRKGKGVELLLEDTGPGLTSEQASRLFDRFYRAESSRSRSGGGAGLGLAICKNIVEAHGGSIGAEHSVLGGLALRIYLPE